MGHSSGKVVAWQNIGQVVYYRTYTSQRAAGPQKPSAVLNPEKPTDDSPCLIQCGWRDV